MTLQLENYGVSELSHSEQQETDGGGEYSWSQVLAIINQLFNSDMNNVAITPLQNGNYSIIGAATFHNTASQQVWAAQY